MKRLLLIAILLTALPAFSAKKLITEETAVSFKEASNGIEMKSIRRMAVGFHAAGELGLGGVALELNFDPKVNFGATYGGGPGFQAVSVHTRYMLGGDWLLPYAGAGYAHWSTHGPVNLHGDTNPSILGDRLLSEGERSRGEFSKHLIYPSFGLQIMQLRGPYAGFSIYAEALVLFEISNLLAAPTGALGMLYYF